MTRRYHTLLTRDDVKSPWQIHFGDYDLDCVMSEGDDLRDDGVFAKNLKVITTGAGQAEITARVNKLNEGV